MIGAIVGAALGYALGEAGGALAGAVVGGVAGHYLLPMLWRKQSGKDSQFLEATFSVMGALCKADGSVSKDEIRASSAFFDQMKLDPAERDLAMASFVRGRQPGFDLEGEIQKLVNDVGSNRTLLMLFLYVQVTAIDADGELAGNERQMFDRILQAMRLGSGEQLQAQALLRGIGDGIDEPLEQQYRMLGVEPDCSDADVAGALARQAEGSSTEALTDAGVNQELQRLAQVYMERLQRAHDEVKAARQTAAAG